MLNEWTGRLADRWRRSRDVVLAPRVRIEVWGDDRARQTYDSFVRRHARYRFTAAKRWGVALLRVPDSFDAYLNESPDHRKRKWKRAQKDGYRYELVAPAERLDEILEINRSAPTRQGRLMDDRYVERERVVREHQQDALVHGILDREGRLRAYAVTIDLGDTVAFSKAIGHAADLRSSVMTLLVCEVVRTCVDRRRATGHPTWLMHDTFWGASEGLATFKTRLGFEPRTVKWAWVDRPAAG